MDNAPEQQEILDRLCIYLKDQFSCRTAILYGSRARGDWDTTSDIDVIAFANGIQTGHIAHRWGNLFLDLFLYPPGTEPEANWLRVHDGRVLFQDASQGDDILAATRKMFLAGPKQMSSEEARTTRLWLEKMLARAENGDVEGDYRRHWLLKDLLEIYFLLRGKWYLGPKKSLALLRDENPAHFHAFRKALAADASLDDVRSVVIAANGSE